MDDVDVVGLMEGPEAKIERRNALLVHQVENCDCVEENPVHVHAGHLGQALAPGDHGTPGREHNVCDGVEDRAHNPLVFTSTFVALVSYVECYTSSYQHERGLGFEIVFEDCANYADTGGLEAEVDHRHLNHPKALTQWAIGQCSSQRSYLLLQNQPQAPDGQHRQKDIEIAEADVEAQKKERHHL